MTAVLAVWAFVMFLVSLISLPSSSSQQATVVVPTIEIATTTTEEIEKPQLEEVKKMYDVVKVVDGDTITVRKNGISETVRLIGVNAPESVDPRRPVQCFGREASQEMKSLLNDSEVDLVPDPTQNTRDKYGRLLAYVYRADGLFINEHLILQGFAHEYTYAAPYKFKATFESAEASARIYKRGLWGESTCSEPPKSTMSTTTAALSGNAKCANNAYNCSHFKSHSEAQALFEACGGIDNDIHKLDSNGDGSACESLP